MKFIVQEIQQESTDFPFDAVLSRASPAELDNKRAKYFTQKTKKRDV